ncbi:MAG: hypothetical protein Q7S40_22415 [Opitutaceae bacterium]|nr:hypothetical protein [Opitutaceae bacterium]
MAFAIRMGVPEMAAGWTDLSTRKQQGKLSKDEEKFFKKLVKALAYLQENPRHNSLASHEIDDLTRKYGLKIFQSYLENNTPAAGRLFWAYGPGKGDITVLAVEPHPEDQKRGAYQRIKLSALPTAKPKAQGKG